MIHVQIDSVPHGIGERRHKILHLAISNVQREGEGEFGIYHVTASTGREFTLGEHRRADGAIALVHRALSAIEESARVKALTKRIEELEADLREMNVKEQRSDG